MKDQHDAVSDFSAIVMAAGHGKRMRSELAKVLHEAAGVPMVAHVVDTTLALGAERCAVVVGYQADAVGGMLRGRHAQSVATAVQDPPRGTGDAVRAGLTAFEGYAGWLLILCGDTPLLHPALLRPMLQRAAHTDCALVLGTAHNDDAHGCGRIVRNEAGDVQGVVEELDCTPDQRAITELNPGVYLAQAGWLRNAVQALNTNNAQGEYYLTDIVAYAATHGGVADATLAPFDELRGVNTPEQLASADHSLRERVIRQHADAGVVFDDPGDVVVDADVRIAPGARIGKGVRLLGRTDIGPGAVVGDRSVLRDAELKPAQQCPADSQLGGE